METPERKTRETEQIIVDNDDFCFVILETDPDARLGYTLHCYLENRSDINLLIEWDNTVVNGCRITSTWATDVAAGMRAYGDIILSSIGMEKNSITTVERIEFRLKAHDYDDFNSGYIYRETLTYKP